MTKYPDPHERQLAEEAQRMLDRSGPWLMLAEAARQSGRSLQTLYTAAVAGRLPCVRAVTRGGRTVHLVRLSAVTSGVGLTPGGRGKYERGKKAVSRSAHQGRPGDERGVP